MHFPSSYVFHSDGSQMAQTGQNSQKADNDKPIEKVETKDEKEEEKTKS